MCQKYPSRNVAATVKPKASLSIKFYEQAHTDYDMLHHVPSLTYNGDVRKHIVNATISRLIDVKQRELPLKTDV